MALEQHKKGFSGALLAAVVKQIALADETERGVSRTRILFFLMEWVKFLVSRDFAASFHSEFGIRGGVILKEKAQSKWREEDKSFMREPVKCEALNYEVRYLLEWAGKRAGGEEWAILLDILEGLVGTSGGKKKRSKVVVEEKEMSLEEMEQMMEDGEEEDDEEEEEEEVEEEEEEEPWSVVEGGEYIEIGRYTVGAP